MKVALSKFGTKFSRGSGILQLMDDLGSALSVNRDMLMMGGGNPAHIPEVQVYFRERMKRILENGNEFERAIGDYDSPQGNAAFVDSLAKLLRNKCGWNIGPENIALTTGSQTSFFFLFNLFAGDFGGGLKRKILFPMVPEYIGYADLGLDEGIFKAIRPKIDYLDDHLFKYRVDLGRLRIEDDIGAICLSRPTNPTGNVVTDDELQRLATLAKDHDIPLIIDSAYGLPFPNILFTEAVPIWNEDIVVCMSLSKLGLPGTRTGIVVGSAEIVSTLSRMNAILSLAPGSMGASLAQDLVESGSLITLCNDVIKPFYEQKSLQVLVWLKQALSGFDYYIHKPEGAIFLWLWLKGLPINSQQLYEQLKRRGVLVVPGHFFFPGLDEDWPHQHECVRITYSQPLAAVQQGIQLIGEEIRAVYEA